MSILIDDANGETERKFGIIKQPTDRNLCLLIPDASERRGEANPLDGRCPTLDGATVLRAIRKELH